MSTSRPFAYNPSLITSGVLEQYGDLSVGYPNVSYGEMMGGLKWWEGPNEDLGYCIGTSLPTGGVLAPDGIYGDVTFWRTKTFSSSEFITLSNKITKQNFTSVSQAVTWLNSNGYWVSMVPPSPSEPSIYVGGYFTTYSGSSTNYFARLNENGSLNTLFSMGSGFDWVVNDIAVQSDGKLIIGGQFNYYSGVSKNYFVRLNDNGSIDTTFNIGTGFDNYTDDIVIQPDGKILVSGQFQEYNGTVQKYITRLNSDGSVDSSFIPTEEFFSSIYSIEIQSDGKIIACGDIVNSIIRLNSNGSTDTSFNVGVGFNNRIDETIIQSDGKIILGGYFTTFTGVSANRIIRLNTDGSRDTSFNIGTGFNGPVVSLSKQTDGKIIVGGYFTTYSGASTNYIIRLNTDGSKDTSFNIGTGFNNYVETTSIQSDGKIIVGGSFTSYSGVSTNYIVRLNSDGSLDTSFNVGTGFNSSLIKIVNTI